MARTPLARQAATGDGRAKADWHSAVIDARALRTRAASDATGVRCERCLGCRQRAAMPFVHLERELWQVRTAAGNEMGPDTPERRGRLLESGAVGRLRPEVERLLADPGALAAAARLLLDQHFTPALAESICDEVELDLADLEARSPRGPTGEQRLTRRPRHHRCRFYRVARPPGLQGRIQLQPRPDESGMNPSEPGAGFAGTGRPGPAHPQRKSDPARQGASRSGASPLSWTRRSERRSCRTGCQQQRILA